MKAILAACVFAVTVVSAADKKAGPAEASNEDLRFSATVLMDRAEMQQALGADLPEGMVLVRLKATPRGEKPLHVSPDDFTLLSRKDGERCPALAPAQIAGRASVTVKAADEQLKSWGTPVTNGPLWSGIGKSKSREGSSDSAKTDASAPAPEPRVDLSKQSDADLLVLLKEKSLPEGDTTKSIEGLLYFRMDGKNKLKDLSLLYKGDAGRLVADFKQ